MTLKIPNRTDGTKRLLYGIKGQTYCNVKNYRYLCLDILLNVILIDLYLAGATLLFYLHTISVSFLFPWFWNRFYFRIRFSDSFFGFVFQTRFLIWESFFIFRNRFSFFGIVFHFSESFLFFNIVFPAQIPESFFQIVFLPEISKSFFRIVFLTNFVYHTENGFSTVKKYLIVAYKLVHLGTTSIGQTLTNSLFIGLFVPFLSLR